MTDAKDREMTVNLFDMNSLLLYTSNIDSGKRWMLYDMIGKPIKKWDNLDNELSYLFDPLQRPVETWLKESGSTTAVLVEKLVYGTAKYADDSSTGDTGDNLAGKPKLIYDQAGLVTNSVFDFKGNLLTTSRKLCQDYDITIDWSSYTSLENENFQNSFKFDAMNRLTMQTKPDATVEAYT